MDTLIELYDERPLENVLATDMFQPKRTVFICNREAGADGNLERKMKDYVRYRGLKTELVFMDAKQYSVSSVLAALRQTVSQYPDCALDITGGTDDELFAAGILCSEKDIPVITYSLTLNRFFNIQNALEYEDLGCPIRYSAEDFFRMAGGVMREGRVDNTILENYFDIIDPFFDIFMKNRRKWGSIVAYFQQVSQIPREQPIKLEVTGNYTVKGERGQRISAPEDVLRKLEHIGMLRDLRIEPEKKVSFVFRDAQVRKWLRDVGSVLELCTYKKCVECGLYNDVHTSVVVDWEKNAGRDKVTNEIDVMAVCGVIPVFISCKTCAVTTEALNELAILRDRFGGKGARAAIVTTESCKPVTVNRARELDIEVIEQRDIISGQWKNRLKALAKNCRT